MIETVTLACQAIRVENVAEKEDIFKTWARNEGRSKFCKARVYERSLQMSDRGEHCANGNAKFQRFALWEAEPST